MADSDAKTNTRRGRQAIKVLIGVAVSAGLVVAGLYLVSRSYAQSPLDELACEFSHIDAQGLHWDYGGILAAYQSCRDSKRQQQLLDLMVTSRATHLVPGVIDSIGPGGYGDTERKMRCVIALTGYDFSEEFEITNIWQVTDVNEVKARLNQWWAENGKEVLDDRGPKDSFDVPNGWSSLTLSLATEKSQYLEVEPMRLTAVLDNHSDTWSTFAYRYRRPAFRLEFLRVVNGKATTQVAQTQFPRYWTSCGNARRWLARPAFLVLDAGAQHVTQEWVNYVYENQLKPGKVTLRAVLTVSHGQHKGKRLASNDVQIEVVVPRGIDAAAHQFLTAGPSVDVGAGQKISSAFVTMSGLVRNSASSYRNPADDYFVATYPESVYAHYVRYTQASVATWYRDSYNNSQGPSGPHAGAAQRVPERLEQIIAAAPRDFPLLADACVMLLEHYRGTGELDKMRAVAAKVTLPELRVLDAELLQRLADLKAHPDKVLADIHRRGRFGRTSLHDAAEKGPPALVRCLIAHGAEIDALSNWGTPLYVAAHSGRKDNVEILVAAGADVNAEHNKRTPLYWPVCRGQVDIIELLLANGAEVNVTDEAERTLEERANMQGQTEVLGILIKAKGQDGRTPLHWAVAEGRKAMVQMLLRNGAEVNSEDNAGQTPLDIALALPHDDGNRSAIVSLLQDYAANGNP